MEPEVVPESARAQAAARPLTPPPTMHTEQCGSVDRARAEERKRERERKGKRVGETARVGRAGRGMSEVEGRGG